MNANLLRVLNKLKVFKYLNFKKEITINNNRFKVPIYNNIGQSYLSAFEPWMLSLLKTISPFITNSFVDVGVNIGQTLLKVKSISSDIKYIGFEPNPVCYNYLENLLDLNHFHNAKIFQLGISNKTENGVLYFTNSSKTDPSASIVNGFRSDDQISQQINIPLATWDTVREKEDFEAISILKIDVEGGELEVLESFKSSLISDRPIIIIEILPTYNKDNTFRIERQKNVEQLLKTLNYTIFRILKENDELIGFKALSKIEIHDNINFCDYVMVPKSKLEAFKRLVKIF
ncbi:hypothetical protein PK35_00175 [Tamlana nanhaiensis]|uniref:Methyltransferase FkbM domain-containing protein n=1 Tax=Neotamlana nanhaiensis TaxID=1382798 RepID=A0A0D7W590_9FLAO|nr:FkbM family methyltransferase [Tamlana nanhaiensis]KJD34281.1 hypothetical protein PK35_00175 [Tamlana nanhaiensis]